METIVQRRQKNEGKNSRFLADNPVADHPPVGVFLQVGFGMHFWINILLTLLGYLPGVLHAIYIILKK